MSPSAGHRPSPGTAAQRQSPGGTPRVVKSFLKASTVTCVVLTVALIELHQHGGWDNQEVPQRWHHRVHHHREPLTEAAQTLQQTIDTSHSPGGAGRAGPRSETPSRYPNLTRDVQGQSSQGPLGHVESLGSVTRREPRQSRAGRADQLQETHSALAHALALHLQPWECPADTSQFAHRGGPDLYLAPLTESPAVLLAVDPFQQAPVQAPKHNSAVSLLVVLAIARMV